MSKSRNNKARRAEEAADQAAEALAHPPKNLMDYFYPGSKRQSMYYNQTAALEL